MSEPERLSLPDDPWGLPPMGRGFERALDDGLAELGLAGARAASAGARRSYEAHARLLSAWGAAINLTSITDPVAVARRHVCDSLTATIVVDESDRDPAGPDLLDLGSGGGYPGLPLAAALPWRRVALVESVVKKARFLEVAARAVVSAMTSGPTPVPAIEVVADRAEELGRDPEERGTWDVVTARAVGSLAACAELGLPLLRIGGILVAWKRHGPDGRLADELRAAAAVVRACGGDRPRTIEVGLADLAGHRLVVVPKVRRTPDRFPRDPGRRGPRR
jgi:16S rRNA (guanine527-N7)-methyltransferase